MAFTQDFRTQRRNYNDGQTRIGEKDRLWYDSESNSIRIGDGETEGGIVVGGAGGGGDYTLPTATTTVKGGVKVDGTTITISNQVISATQPDLSSYATQTYVTTRGYITSYTETDPVFLAHPANNVTNTKISNWDTAYGWGNHASAGYLTTVGTISYNDLSNKPTLFSGSYTDLTNKPTLFSGSYTDLTNKPTIPTSTSDLTNGAGYITSSALSGYATETYVTTRGYITSYTETDPVFVASAAYNITSTQITNWDTAYGWGNHASAGYLTSVGTISYNDLSDKPAIPSNVSQLVNDSGYITAAAIPAQFTFNVAADDSTQRTIGTQETVKFIGAGGITTASDAEGNITITQGAGGAGVFSNEYLLTGTTTNNSEIEILVGGSTRIPIATNIMVNYEIFIAAKRTDVLGSYAYFKLSGSATNEGGTVSDVGSLYEIVVSSTNPAYLVDVRSDNINKTINVYVKGDTGHTISWKAVVQTIEI